MLEWFEKHPGTASWVQLVGSIAAIWYAARIASEAERRQRNRAWDAAIAFGGRLVQALSELRDTTLEGSDRAEPRHGKINLDKSSRNC